MRLVLAFRMSNKVANEIRNDERVDENERKTRIRMSRFGKLSLEQRMRAIGMSVTGQPLGGNSEVDEVNGSRDNIEEEYEELCRQAYG